MVKSHTPAGWYTLAAGQPGGMRCAPTEHPSSRTLATCSLSLLSSLFLFSILFSFHFFFSLCPAVATRLVQQCVPCGTYSYYSTIFSTTGGVCVCVCVCVLVILTLSEPMDCSPVVFCPWDSPGKNTGVGYHSLLWGSS